MMTRAFVQLTMTTLRLGLRAGGSLVFVKRFQNELVPSLIKRPPPTETNRKRRFFKVSLWR